MHRDELDLCLLEGVATGGRVVHREAVVWTTARTGRAHLMHPLPLAIYDEGCTYRQWALEALQQEARAYWIAFVSPSMAGIQAAVRTGLAAAPIGRSTLNQALRLLAPEEGFPLLPVSEVSLHQGPSAGNEVVACFADYVTDAFPKIVP